MKERKRQQERNKSKTKKKEAFRPKFRFDGSREGERKGRKQDKRSRGRRREKWVWRSERTKEVALCERIHVTEFWDGSEKERRRRKKSKTEMKKQNEVSCFSSFIAPPPCWEREGNHHETGRVKVILRCTYTWGSEYLRERTPHEPTIYLYLALHTFFISGEYASENSLSIIITPSRHSFSFPVHILPPICLALIYLSNYLSIYLPIYLTVFDLSLQSPNLYMMLSLRPEHHV